MKKLFTLMMMAITINVFAQSPQKMSYQCVVRNASGALVTNQAVGIKISILQGSASGTAVYTETLTPTTNANGLVSIEIGGGTGFDLINWSAGPYFLKTETDPAGGTNYTITGTSQLVSVPYALYAKSAANGFSGNYNDLTDKPTLFDGAWVSLTGKPTTVAGFGITDAVTTSGDQIVAGNKTFTGTINASNKIITNVATPVSISDAVNKAYIDKLIESVKGVITGDKVIDNSGNIYSIVTIGTQVWMAENLRTSKYNDGTSIPKVTNNSEWHELTTGAYCWYNNDSATYEIPYGKLYNWFTVNTRKLCPNGWHVSGEKEWIVLTTYLGGAKIAGGKLKETGTAHWNSPNTDATNESGFTALPGGGRSNLFDYIRIKGYWWIGDVGMVCSMENISTEVGKATSNEINGFSVRCIKN
jgi:uncharacterized protein (TIGR02145 family)